MNLQRIAQKMLLKLVGAQIFIYVFIFHHLGAAKTQLRADLMNLNPVFLSSDLFNISYRRWNLKIHLLNVAQQQLKTTLWEQWTKRVKLQVKKLNNELFSAFFLWCIPEKFFLTNGRWLIHTYFISFLISTHMRMLLALGGSAQSVPQCDGLLCRVDHVYPVLQLRTPGVHEGTQHHHSQRGRRFWEEKKQNQWEMLSSEDAVFYFFF